jgi:hypothetical protein
MSARKLALSTAPKVRGGCATHKFRDGIVPSGKRANIAQTIPPFLRCCPEKNLEATNVQRNDY